MKKNAVFREVAPFFPQLRAGEGPEKPGEEMVDGTDHRPPVAEPRAPVVEPRAPVAELRQPTKSLAKEQALPPKTAALPSSTPATASKGAVIKQNLVAPPKPIAPIAAPLKKSIPGPPTALPQSTGKIAPPQIPVQKTQITLPKQAPPAKKVEETAKRSFTPNKR